MDVRIGVTQTPKEIEIELADDADRDKVVARSRPLLAGDGVLWLTDRGAGGRRPAAKVAYVEIGSPHRSAGSASAPLSRPLTPGRRTGRRCPRRAGLLDRQLVFVTGKGGVGKTTVAAGLALLAAEPGERALVCEVDAKGDLAALRRGPPVHAREIQPGLWAMSMDTEASLSSTSAASCKWPWSAASARWPRPSTSWPPPLRGSRRS